MMIVLMGEEPQPSAGILGKIKYKKSIVDVTGLLLFSTTRSSVTILKF